MWLAIIWETMLRQFFFFLNQWEFIFLTACFMCVIWDNLFFFFFKLQCVFWIFFNYSTQIQSRHIWTIITFEIHSSEDILCPVSVITFTQAVSHPLQLIPVLLCAPHSFHPCVCAVFIRVYSMLMLHFTHLITPSFFFCVCLLLCFSSVHDYLHLSGSSEQHGMTEE